MARVATVLACLTLAAPASAIAATWSAPQTLGTTLASPFCCGQPGFARDGTGAAVLVEHAFGEHSGGGVVRTHFLTRAPGGPWIDHPRRAGRRRQFDVEHVQVMSDGGLLLLGEGLIFNDDPAVAEGGLFQFERLTAEFGRVTPGGVTIEAGQVLFEGPAPNSYDFASNAAGDAVAAWGVRHGRGKGVYMRRLGGDHSCGPRRRLTTRPGVASVAAGVGPGGQAVVTWTHGGRLLGRMAGSGERFGPVIDLGPEGYRRIAVGRRGRLLLALRHPVARYTATLDVTLTGPMGAAPETTRLLGASKDVYGGPIPLFDRAGRGLVAWTKGERTQVATFAGGAPAVETIEPRGVVHSMDVSRSGGVALALVAATRPSSYGGFVALRGPSGGFGAGELATPEIPWPDGASVAFDPLRGEPSLFYLQRESEDEPVDGAYVVERQGG